MTDNGKNPSSEPEWINPDEENQARKQVSRLLQSPAGLKALTDGLLQTVPGRQIVQSQFGITVIDRKEQESKPIVAILIPTHKKPENETGQALERMIPIAREKCHVMMRPSIASSVVHWVRNQLLAMLYESKAPFDYVLFMDDDMVPAPEALSILLDRKVDVIGAVCTVRQDPPLPNARHYNPTAKCFQTADIDRPGIWKVGAIGTGFMLISKKALDDIGEYTLSQRYWIKNMGMSPEFAKEREIAERKRAAEDNNKFWFEFLKSPAGAGEVGEDISFCIKAAECGYEIYADSTAQVGHIGNYPFSLGDYWAYRNEALATGKVVPLAQAEIPVYESDSRIVLLLPTRGRPDNIVRMLQSLHESSHVMPEVIARIDDDDEEIKSALDQLIAAGEKISYRIGPRITLTEYWNEISGFSSAEIVMFAADDIVFKTKGWDSLIRETFDTHPDKMIFVHGDDGHWGGRFGTHGFLHRKWIDALGYVLPPYFSSDYGDTWINDVANMLGRRVFLPIVIEHMHFLFGKAQMDATYADRLERGKKDNVAALYASMESKRKEDAEKIMQAAKVEEAVLVG